jgi:hypothetical protein
MMAKSPLLIIIDKIGRILIQCNEMPLRLVSIPCFLTDLLYIVQPNQDLESLAN